jgi:hypothetical protein
MELLSEILNFFIKLVPFLRNFDTNVENFKKIPAKKAKLEKNWRRKFCHSDTRHNDTQHNSKKNFADCRYLNQCGEFYCAECCCAQFSYAECKNAWFHCSLCCYAEYVMLRDALTTTTQHTNNLA